MDSIGEDWIECHAWVRGRHGCRFGSSVLNGTGAFMTPFVTFVADHLREVVDG